MVKKVFENQKKGVVSFRIYMDEDEDIILSISAFAFINIEFNITDAIQRIKKH